MKMEEPISETALELGNSITLDSGDCAVEQIRSILETALRQVGQVKAVDLEDWANELMNEVLAVAELETVRAIAANHGKEAYASWTKENPY